MKKSTLKLITHTVKSLRHDYTRPYIDNIAHVYHDDGRAFLVCTNGVVLCHIHIDSEVDPGNYRVESKYTPKKSELEHRVNDTDVDYYLRLSEVEYPKWRMVVPSEFDETKPRGYQSFMTANFSQAINAAKSMGMGTWTIKHATDMSPARLQSSISDDTYIIMMPCKI